MATQRQATARKLDRDPVSAPRDARNWRLDVTSQLDDSASGEALPGFDAPARPRKPAPAAGPAERMTYAPPREGGVPFAQQRAAQMPQRAPARTPAIGTPLRLAGLAVAGVAALLALYVVLSAVFGFLQVKMDDIQYGRPRTTHLDAYVGHAGEQDGQPSHFLALNLDRRIVLIELPGGDTKNASTITGPYLFGDGEDLTPVKLSAEDVNGDGAADLLVNVKNEQLVYINDKDKNTFHLMTPEERAKLPAEPTTGAPAARETSP
ncbi:MAG TPA: hypothetical protein VF276_13005 [Chloroflexia bacterium]